MENIESNINSIKKDQALVLRKIKNISVENDKQMTKASEFLSIIKEKIRNIEKNRIFFVKSLNDQVRKINGEFKKVLEPFQESERKIKGAIGSYVNEQNRIAEEKRQKEEEARREEAARIAEKENISRQKAAAQLRRQKEEEERNNPKEPEPQKMVKTEKAKVITRQVLKFEIVDPSKVPDEYKIIDERLVRKAVMSGEKKIAGVRIWKDTQVSSC